MLTEVDNLSGGDCGYLAMAIGFIKIIQDEYRDQKASPTLQKLLDKGLVGITLQELLDIDLVLLHKAPKEYAKRLLNEMQMSLRSIVAEAHKNELRQKIEQEEFSQGAMNEYCVENSSIFGKFMELVKESMTGRTSSEESLSEIAKFNELALSSEVVSLAQNAAAELAPLLKNKTFDEQQKIENAFVKKVLLADCTNPASCILHGADSIKQGGWATLLDLAKIAEELEVNLLVDNVNSGTPIVGRPTVNLNHKAYGHWTTTVDLPVPNTTLIATRPGDDMVERVHIKKLTSKEEQVLETTLSSQSNTEKIGLYKKNLQTLLANHGLFADVADKIDLEHLDKAKAKANKGESDEDFSVRLQEAEFRGSGLK